MTRAVLTLAVGKSLYFRFAINLARSFQIWNASSDIAFYIATDTNHLLPADLGSVKVIELKPGSLGFGFSPKLYLDVIAPADETLFIDADCLCVRPLAPVFEKFSKHQVSVVGRIETEGELFGDIASRCQAVGVPWTVRFCGGMYFLKKGATSSEVFGSARALESRYDELGIVRLRGLPNEEPLVGLGMALAGEKPIPEDGLIKAEPMFFSGPVEIDVFRGNAHLSNSPHCVKPYPEWQIPAEARPAIVHFNASFAEQPPYTVEVKRMELVFERKWPLTLARLFTRITIEFPFYVTLAVKDTFRPVHRMLFGARPIKPSPRMPGEAE